MNFSVQSPHLTLRERIRAYVQLTRLDRPVGIELLLWPTLWACRSTNERTSRVMANCAGLYSRRYFHAFCGLCD
jgi:4-hydroxybenzoate polyprenyltransferase